MLKIGEMLSLNARRYPEKTAVVYKEERLTYRELNARVNCLANHLLEIGVEKGDRVGFLFYNTSRFVETFFAVAKIGAIAAPLNFRMVPREIKWCLDHLRCKVFVYDDAFSQQVDPIRKDLSTVQFFVRSSQNIPSGEYHFEALSREGSIGEPTVAIDFQDPVYVIFTGGTTGVPKAAIHTHASASAACMIQLIRNKFSGPDEVTLTQIPLFHGAGMTQMIMVLSIGGKMVLVETMNPLEILRLIEQERATYMGLLPPSTYIRLLDVPNFKDFDTTSVTRLITSVAAFPKPLMVRLLDGFPSANLLFGFGQTETCNCGALGIFTRAMIEEDSERIKSVGQEHPFVNILLVDDDGQEVPVGRMGEAIVRSPANMVGYFDQPELTAQTLKDGWVYTGDYLKKDEDGYFYFMDRKKDMIKTGGENVFAQEVEKVIMSHNSVEFCAVIGIPDEKFGEAVMAVIKMRQGFSTTEEEIIEHCKQFLSSYKKPRRLAFVDAIPMNDAGKVQKFKLREFYSENW
jgi:acyl-CoA synthetase (AMP-forming)/AMP-acid ligase II